MDNAMSFNALLLIFVTQVCANVEYYTKMTSSCAFGGDTSIWMTCATKQVKNRSLLNLAIPGSHNSFAYWLEDDPYLDFAPDIGNGDGHWIKFLSFFGQGRFRTSLKNWALTQSMDAVQQLYAGIRYFDIRIAYDRQSRELRFSHLLWGRPVFYELEQMNQFLLDHPLEIIILDFNHFNALTTEHHRILTNYLVMTFNHRLVCSSQWGRLDWLSLEKLQTRNQQVVVIYHNSEGLQMSQNCFWPGQSVNSHFADTRQVGEMLKFLDMNLRNRTFETNRFFVYQGVLTPAASTAKHFRDGSLRGELAGIATPSFANWLGSLTRGVVIKSPYIYSYHYEAEVLPEYNFDKFGIFMADFVEMSNFIIQVIQLNY